MGQALLRLEPETAVVDPFDVPGGWRVGEPAWTVRRLVVAGHEPVEVRARGRARDADVVVGTAEPVATSTSAVTDGLAHTRDGRSRRYAVATGADGVVWIGRDGSAWGVREQEPLEAARTAAGDAGGPVVSPMPGTVTVVEVAEGDEVTAGTTLVVVEAMKMEHVLTAPADGTVRDLRARTGGTVARGDVLVVVEPATESSERGTSISTAEESG
jgi:acetyl-CoA/propionyl-CoA carboxylase biotin carboxyl carrier protein